MIAIPANLARRQSVAQGILLIGLIGYWLIFVHICWPNYGGSGTYLPYNLLAWCYVAAFCTLFWLIKPGALRLVLMPAGKLLAGGGLLMSLPLLWSPDSETVAYALPRITGLWAGLAFWFTLRQCSFSSRQQHILLYAFVCAGICETVIVLVELYGPAYLLPTIWQQLLEKYGRGAVGVFQQVNVTASFIAVSLAASLLLLGLRSAANSARRIERIRVILLAGAIVLLSATLTAMYSRVGWLGAVLAIGGLYYLLSFGRFRDEGQHNALLILLPLVGIGVGIGMMNISLADALEAHSGSNHQRLLTLYQTAIYASHHPLLGYGAGTYEGYYQSFLATLPGGNPGVEVMAHPHNEFLYQYAEGGTVALGGVLLWCGLYLWLGWKTKAAFQRGIAILMLPLLLHVQVEYPLYYSVPHWLALLTLLRMTEPAHDMKYAEGRLRLFGNFTHITLFILAVYGTVVSYQGYRAGTVLDKFENSKLNAPESITALNVPWMIKLRFDQDLTLLKLIEFTSTHDPDLLRAFSEENKRWVSVHASENLYSNQIAVLNYLHEGERAERWKKRAQRIFPWHKEFQDQ